MADAGDFMLPVAFQFAVSIAGSDGEDAAFREAEGLESQIDVETLVEGGENRFVHKLPKAVSHPNLRLKRGILGEESPLAQWCKSTLEGDFAEPITPKDVVVNLLDHAGSPVASWSIGNAWPVKWAVGGFNAMENAIAVETVELAYTTLRRMPPPRNDPLDLARSTLQRAAENDATAAAADPPAGEGGVAPAAGAPAGGGAGAGPAAGGAP